MTPPGTRFGCQSELSKTAGKPSRRPYSEAVVNALTRSIWPKGSLRAEIFVSRLPAPGRTGTFACGPGLRWLPYRERRFSSAMRQEFDGCLGPGVPVRLRGRPSPPPAGRCTASDGYFDPLRKYALPESSHRGTRERTDLGTGCRRRAVIYSPARCSSWPVR